MPNLLIPLYRFFRSNRIAFYLFLLGSVMVMLYFALQLRFEEDISGAVSNPADPGRLDEAIRNFSAADKLIVMLSLADTLADPDPGLLAESAGNFIDSLGARFDSGYIRTVEGRISDTLMGFWFDYFRTHLPFYLEEQDYERVGMLLAPDSVESRIRKAYTTLISPAGFAMKNMILRDPLGLTFIALNRYRDVTAGENYTITNGFIFTRDNRNLLIFITPANPSSETSKNAKLVFGIGKLLRQIATSSAGKVTGYCFGSVAVAVGNAEQLKQDIFLTLIIAFSLIILLTGLYFRSIKIPLLGFLPALFGGGFALAMLSLVKGSISVIALGIGSVILGLIIDYALYYINRFRKSSHAEEVLKELTQTIFLCALTSAGAFLCLLFLRSTVLKDLGLFAALSIAGAAFFALVILPQFLTAGKAISKPGIAFIDRFSSIAFEKKKWLVALLLLLAIASLFFFRKVDFEKDMMSMNFMTPELKRSEEQINRITEVSLKSVFIASMGKDRESSLRRDEIIREHLRELKKKGIIRSYSGTGSVILSDSMQRVKIALWNEFWTAERKEKLESEISSSAKKYRFREGAFSSFTDLLNTDFKPLTAAENEQAVHWFGREWITGTGGLALTWSIAKVKQEDKLSIYHEFSGMNDVVVFDKQLLTNRFIENVRHDFELLVNLSMLFVTLLLLISFGRIEPAVYTSVPMYFSWLVTLGFMGFAGIRFNIFNIIISSFIFGLGVDYSIIMMRAVQQKYKYGFAETMNYKVSIFLSSATTLSGVGALFFARHPALNSIALISVIGIIAVVIASYVFIPLFSEWFLFSQLRKRKFPVTARILLKSIITWGNITMIGLIMMISGLILSSLIIVRRETREYWFHWLFSKLSKAYIAVTFPTRRRLENPSGEDLSKPAVIISNHQSLIETPAFLRLHPKILILANDWVWNSPLFGPVAKFASFYNVENGIDAIMDQLRNKVAQGYSILVFPEGHRSEDHRIRRFHRGAFYLAEKLEMDILPVVVFGSGDFLPKGAFWGRPNSLYMKIMERVTPTDTRFGTGYSERTRKFRQYYIGLYRELRSEYGTCRYYRSPLILNYLFKGPVLEWYLRIKMRLGSNYTPYHRNLPMNGRILDIGCGYGYISYMLLLAGDDRQITGVDHDPEKIEVAQHGFLKSDRIGFVCADITNFEITPHDGFLISDLLHYLPENEQENLMEGCMKNLEPGGVILIRDADSALREKHKGTRITEFLSTKVIRFNKTGNEGQLHFTSLEKIRQIAGKHNMKTELLEESAHTSNLLVRITRI